MLRQIDAGLMTHRAVPPTGQCGKSGKPGATWHDLTTDLLWQITGYLDDRPLCAMARTDRRSRAALASAVNLARIGWRIARVSNLSTLHDALREIDAAGLTATARGVRLAALAERLPLLHLAMGPAACDAVLQAIAALPAAARQAPLCELLRGFGWFAGRGGQAHQPSHQGRLLHLACDVPERQQAAALLAFFVNVQWLAPALVAELPGCLRRALALAGVDRERLLAAMLRSVSLLEDRPEFGLLSMLQSVYEGLVQADGRPAVAERTALLSAVADHVGALRLLPEDEARTVRVRQWIIEAAQRLRGDGLLQVLMRVAAWPSPTLPQRLWDVGAGACCDAAALARWLAAMHRHPVQGLSEVWAKVWADAMTLAPPSRADAIASLASALTVMPSHAEQSSAWLSLFQHTDDALPAAHRAGPLQALAAALPELGDMIRDPRWDTVIDAAACLAPTQQVAVLHECCVDSQALLQRHWDRYLDQMRQLPAAALAVELERLAWQLRKISPASAASAWPELVALLHRLPLEHRMRPWLVLWRVVGITFGPANRAVACKGLLQALMQQGAAAREQWLVAAAALDHPDAPLLLLERVAALPVARRASVLTVLARGSVMTRSGPECIAIWQALFQAVRQLPPAYRGSPLHALADLRVRLARAYGEPSLEPLEPLAALCEGVPAIDLPSDLTAAGAPL